MKANSIAFTDAKSSLSKFARLAEGGQTILVLKHRRPAFVMGPVPNTSEARIKHPGIAAGRICMSADFDVTSDDMLKAFEGEPCAKRSRRAFR